MNKGITKSGITFIKGLQQKQGRSQEGLFIIEGEKLVSELLDSNLDIDSIFHLAEYSLPQSVDNEKITIISANELERISCLNTPNKVLALARIPKAKDEVPKESSIYVWRLNDPGNAGTILRIADWYGISTVIFSDGSVDPYSPKVVQASMGSIFRIDVRTDDVKNSILNEIIAANVPLVGAEMDGESITTSKIPSMACILMGSESHGIPQEISKKCTQRVTIPRIGKAESLNVGVACGIIVDRWKNG